MDLKFRDISDPADSVDDSEVCEAESLEFDDESGKKTSRSIPYTKKEDFLLKSRP